MFRKFGKEDSEGAMRKHELNMLKQEELEQEIQDIDVTDDEDDRLLEESDGSDDLSD